MGSLPGLINIDVAYNHFTGSFPSSVGLLQPLVELTLNNNSFSGSFTRSIGAASLLEVFFVVNNLLTGSLDIFNASVQNNLTTIDVSSNMFSGSIPVEPFKMPHFISFAAVSNCIHGSIPAEICGSSSLLVLALDGLSTASACQDRYFSKHLEPFSEIHSYGLKYSLSGGIPLCLFNMSQLQTLHLSGNGIVDSLTSDDLILSSKLTDLSLSHNQMHGSIPLAFQNRSWDSLDLSFNQFDGSLMERFPQPSNSSSLYLQVNRLSGPIPHSLKHVDEISILDGNLFGCFADRSDLPVNDPSVDVYECGSNSFNYAVYVWVAFVAIFGFALLLLFGFTSRNVNFNSEPKIIADGSVLSVSQQVTENVLEWYNAFSASTQLENIKVFGSFVIFVCQICFLVTLFVLIVLMPTYIVLTHFYSTYSFEYAWTVSAIYISGLVPAVVLLPLYLLLFSLIVWRFFLLVYPFDSQSNLAESGSRSTTCFWYFKAGSIVALNVIVIVGANVAYVFIENNYGSVAVKLTQIALAAFKLLWYGFVARPLLKTIRESKDGETSDQKSDLKTKYTNVNLEVFIVLFNNLFAPFVAVSFVSSQCFYNVFSSPPAVSASYHFATCELETASSNPFFPNTTVCAIEDDQTINTSYSPPFEYHYECSSAYISTYSPIFVFTFIIISFVSPMFQILLSYLVRMKGVENWKLYPYFISCLMPVLHPEVVLNSVQNVRSQWFEMDLFVVRIINILSILLTFGCVVPPLAVIGCLAMFNFSYFNQMAIGRAIVRCSLANSVNLHAMVDKINGDCEGVFAIFLSSIGMIVPFGMLFYAFLLFDMLGSSVGALNALWAPSLICLFPLLVMGVMWCWKIFSRDQSNEERRRSSLGNKLIKKSELNEQLGQSLINNEF